ncbi:MAG TPA: molybdate ABC transporter permease subunit, partial [Polyangiales bacterium]|nr:molybdate ABC transporter permease subunit [Polyangiales bacterium]
MSWGSRSAVALAGAAGVGLAAFLALPVLALVVTSSPAKLLAGLQHPVTLPALLLSAATTSVALAVVVALGTPLAYWLAGARGALARAVETLVQLPMVIPPAVAGIALLLSFGRR